MEVVVMFSMPGCSLLQLRQALLQHTPTFSPQSSVQNKYMSLNTN